ncbi:cytochrome P450 [Sphingopyxis sp.]|uniref:cytochrome P450 n=1 Tax=Sphingopyxis sp. TaxID=1908224 RepID=UPI003D144861
MTDLGDPGLYEQGIPHDLFAALRRDDPVHWNPESDGPGYWAILRHADIVHVSRNPGIFSSAHEHGGHRIFNENEVGLTGAGEAAVGIPFISRDPPIHTRYRKFIMPALAPVRLDGIESRIEERAEALLAKMPMGQAIDIVPLLSGPLPLLTLAELLGVAPETWEKLYHWTNAFVGEDDPEFRTSSEAMAAIMGEFFAFSQELFEARRAEPGGDIASLLANAEIDGRPVPFADFVANLILVLVGGNETTRNSISHSIINFAANPDQWDALRAEPDLMKTAPAEMVRHATPVIHMRRTATTDTEIGGVRIAAGDKVVMFYSSGNRDEAVFDDPDRFDIARKGPVHVGFGAGQHVCVGSRLAEMQLRVVFRLLARRVTAFQVEDRPRRFRSNFINGLKSVHMTMVA